VRWLGALVLLVVAAAGFAAWIVLRPEHSAPFGLGAAPDVYRVSVPEPAYGGGALSGGACTAYRPLAGDRHDTIFIDPGHGGPDPGTDGATSAGDTLVEKDLTLQIAKDLRDDLRRLGYTVVLSRTADTSVVADWDGHRDAEARVACANAAGAKALLSVHFNGFDDPTVGGAETYFDAARQFSSENVRLAALVQQGLINALHGAGWAVPDRGVLTDDGAGNAYAAEAIAYGHLFLLGPEQPGWNDLPSSMPGALTEPLFITRPSEGDVAASAAGQKTIAAGLANGLDAFMRGRPTPPSPND
jgi:N-acetylmuramoyl-L-alanine amidase